MPNKGTSYTQVMIQVNTIRVDGKAAVVEWFTGADTIPHRAIVPASKVVDGSCRQEVLEAGLPYGLPWEQLKLPEITAEQLAVALRKHGVWTGADYQRNPNQAMAALMSVLGGPFQKLGEFVHQKSGGKK